MPPHSLSGLLAVALLATVVLLAPGSQGRALLDEPAETYDVIVVGAGMAGRFGGRRPPRSQCHNALGPP